MISRDWGKGDWGVITPWVGVFWDGERDWELDMGGGCMRLWMYSSATEMCSWTQLLLCYVNFTLAEKRRKILPVAHHIQTQCEALPSTADTHFSSPRAPEVEFSQLLLPEAPPSSTEKGPPDLCNRNHNTRQTPVIQTEVQARGRERESNEGIEFLPQILHFRMNDREWRRKCLHVHTGEKRRCTSLSGAYGYNQLQMEQWRKIYMCQFQIVYL